MGRHYSRSKGSYKEAGEAPFIREHSDRTRVNVSKLKEGRLQLDVRILGFCSEGGKALERISKRGGGCLVCASIQGQAGRGSEL